MYKSLITTTFFLLIGLQIQAQWQHGLHLGMNVGKYLTSFNGKSSVETSFNEGYELGYLLEYTKGRHTLATGADLILVNSGYKAGSSFNRNEAFVFLSVPMTYSFRFAPRWKITAGIQHHFLQATDLNLVGADGALTQGGTWSYYLGWNGGMEYKLSTKWALEAQFKNWGYLKADEEPVWRFIAPSLRFKYRW